MKNFQDIVVYQAKNGAIELQSDANAETLWATLQQIANLFETDKSGISRHIKNIFASGELRQASTVAKIATVQKEGGREVSRQIEYFNLDMILSVGYRVKSKKATVFRQWVTKTLRSHIVDGYTINKNRLAHNYDAFLKAVEQVKTLLPSGGRVDAASAMELTKMFASTWFSLEAYDTSRLPKGGTTKRRVEFTAEELKKALGELKVDLMAKKETTHLFGSERGGITEKSGGNF